MFKMNRRMEYALIALKYMSRKAPGQLTSAKEICDTYHTPFDPTSRVLQIMTQHGILRAAQGVHGGYQITRDLSRVSLGDLTAIITGPITIATCIHGDAAECHCGLTDSCTVIKSMARLNQQIKDLFDTVKLDAFLEVPVINATYASGAPVPVRPS